MSQKFESFGKYLLLEKLATGGMAEVFLARAPGAAGIAKFLAVKRILPQFNETPEFIDMFKDEAKIAINLSHSNIVSIHEFGVEDEQFFIAMDYVEGRNLRQILNKMKKATQNFSLDQIIFVIKEVAAGLDNAHRCLDGSTGRPLNITHRDMSPQNIMISFEGEVKVVDFGIAKAETQLETTRAGTLKGKFGYMSPEQADGQSVDLRTDIFSLGIVLWELLANDRLFIANNEINTLRKIRDCQIPSLRKINPNIHAELERIALKALARDRNLRYQTAAAFHRDLSRFLNRQYPDFSPHDFAVFIKTLFADEILNSRRRMIEYSNVQVVSPAIQPKIPVVTQPQMTSDLEQKTKVDVTSTASFVTSPTMPPPDASAPAENTFSKSNINFSQDPDIKIKIPQTQSNIKMGMPEAPTPAGPIIMEETGLTGTQEEIQLSVQKNYNSTFNADESSMSRSLSRYSSSQIRVRAERRGMSFMSFLILIGFVFFGYAYATKYFPTQMSPVIQFLNPYIGPLHKALGLQGQQGLASTATTPAPKTATIEIKEAAPTAVVESTDVLIVSSSPSGAEILIDNVSTGQITPSRVEVPKNKNFTIALKRAGYIDYIRNNSSKEVTSGRINASLEKALVGYLDIEVHPPRDVEVSINGVQIKKPTFPIVRYLVPANVKLLVRAENKATGEVDEQNVIVPEDRRVQVDLSPKPRARKPSGK